MLINKSIQKLLDKSIHKNKWSTQYMLLKKQNVSKTNSSSKYVYKLINQVTHPGSHFPGPIGLSSSLWWWGEGRPGTSRHTAFHPRWPPFSCCASSTAGKRSAAACCTDSADETTSMWTATGTYTGRIDGTWTPALHALKPVQEMGVNDNNSTN